MAPRQTMSDERISTEGDQGIRVAAAERALRAGGLVRIADRGHVIGVSAVDGAHAATVARRIADARDGARLVMSGHRARALGLPVPTDATIAMPLVCPSDAAAVVRAAAIGARARLAGSLAGRPVDRAEPAEQAGVQLAKRAGLLPVVLAGRGVHDETAAVEPIPAAAVGAVASRAAGDLIRVVEAPVPTALAEDARLVLFRSSDAPIEHVALVIGDPREVAAPLCRLHSECLTGDIFGSLRCDCGEQLQGAIAQMNEAGAGVLLYLRQEGRGIGLVNKLRAYRLQDEGLDTVDANTHLGFHSDERDFGVAAAMLGELGLNAVRLLTNNPQKVEQLARHGISVEERVPLQFAANRYNSAYLETKARRSGHILPFGAAGAWRTGT